MTPVQTLAATATLLAQSNLFMTFAWYGHLKHLQSSPWWIAALVSWGIAAAEYLLQVPAGESLRLDYLWARLCLVGAVYFSFR